MSKLSKLQEKYGTDKLRNTLLEKLAQVNVYHRVRTTEKWDELLTDYKSELQELVMAAATSNHLGGLSSPELQNQVHNLTATINLLEDFISQLQVVVELEATNT